MITPNQASDENRLSRIDGLRGVLALIVFFHHFLLFFCSPFIIGGEDAQDAILDPYNIYSICAYTPLNLFYNPGFAVGMFFIISGYVLSYKYFRTGAEQYLRDGATKRYIRLAVPVAATCLLIWIFHRLHVFHSSYHTLTEINREWMVDLLPDSFTNPIDVLYYALRDVFFGKTPYNPVLWTMSPELFGSFFVFIFLLLTHRMRTGRRIIMLLAFLCLQLYVKSYSAHFTLGIILGLTETSYNIFARISAQKYVRWILFATGLYLASYPFYAVRGAVFNSMYSPIAVDSTDTINNLRMTGNFLVFTVFVISKNGAESFNRKIFSFLGNISFGLYLLHLPIMLAISTRIFDLLHDKLRNTANIPITLVFTMGILFGISWLFYRLVDRYAIKWASNFTRFLWK